MSGEFKLCKDCSFFIHSTKNCGRTQQAPDYVYGAAAAPYLAQVSRESGSKDMCGPEAKFFAKIVPADDYAEVMIRRDQRERHEGRAEHDRDFVGRILEAGH